MKRNRAGRRYRIAAALAAGIFPLVCSAQDGKHDLQLKLRGVYWGDEGRAYPSAAVPNPPSVRYEQSALGFELNYKSPFWANVIGFDASVYAVAKLTDNGTPTTQLVEVGNDGQLEDGYVAVGQALVKVKWADQALVKAGYQLHDSLLLKSTNNRAVPDTYSGINVLVTPDQGHQHVRRRI